MSSKNREEREKRERAAERAPTNCRGSLSFQFQEWRRRGGERKKKERG